MYIDTSDATDGSGRVCLNAKIADIAYNAKQSEKLSSSLITQSSDLNSFIEGQTFKTGIYTQIPINGIDNHGIVLSGGWATDLYGFQLAIDDDQSYKMALRQKTNSNWSDWKLLPMADGQHASGTWDIDISGKANSATKLETANCINGIQFDGSSSISNYATCSTAAGTAAKVATIQNNGSFILEPGARVSVKFTYANSAANSTLNVNSTGAKTIRYRDANLQSSQYWAAGQVIDFVYDGSFWYVIGTIRDNNNIYSAVTTTADGLMTASDKIKLDKYPDVTTETTKYLKADGTWQEIPTFIKSGSTAASGLVPTPPSTVGTTKFLCEDGIWKEIQTANSNYYGVCSTSSATIAKTVTVDDTFELVAGAQVTIQFTNANTTISPTLNVNSTGAKIMTQYGEKTWQTLNKWNSGVIYTFVYDGTYWVNINADPIFEKSGSGASSGLVPTPPTTAGTTKFLCEDATWKDIPASSIYYGTCTNAASAQIKTVSVDETFKLVAGVQVVVKFTQSNTVTNPTLKVNNTTAKAITWAGGYFTRLKAGTVHIFVYDGSYWVNIGDESVFVQSGSTAAAGLVPAPPTTAGSTKFLCEDGTWAVPTGSGSATDTLNTAGSTNTSSKIFLIGATSQAANPQTYSHDTAYVDTDGHLYSNSKQVVNLSDTQALTNKTYNGYTLGAACAKSVTDSSSASAISTGTNLVTERDVYYGLPKINNSHTYNSNTNIYAPTSGGTSGYILKANGSTSTPTWVDPSTLLGDLSSGGSLLGTYTTATAPSSLPTGLTYIQLPSTAVSTGDPTSGTCLTTVYSSSRGFQLGTNSSSDIYLRTINSSTSYNNWFQIWRKGNSVTGAVWNDYAEYRESDCEEFGYVLMEKGDDTLTKTTERLSHFAGISSDTWGFSQGETEKAKTPIAVAGRVLVYPYQDRNNYKPGDCVCAAPGGTVDIMTREEVREYPDRIVGTISCVPDYEEWGGGEGADRPATKVNNRIWIKIR